MRLSTIAMRQVRRNPVRSALTVLGVAIAMAAFGFLRTVLVMWYSGVEQASAERLITRAETSLMQPLPMAYRDKIQRVPGVTQVAATSFLVGYVKNPDDLIGAFATEAAPFLALYPEYVLTPEETKAWLGDRAGCIVGERLSKKYGYHLGDTVSLQGTSYPGEWRFTVRGIYKGRDKRVDTSGMAIHFRYLDDSVEPERRGQPNLFLIGIAHADDSPRIARAIDGLFHDTPIQTRTESEKAFGLSFLSMTSAIVHALEVVAGVILVIMGLILGNTLAMSVRERSSEIAVLKAIGFTGGRLALLFTGESAVLAGVGGAIGIFIARPIMNVFSAVTEEAVGGTFPPAVLTTQSMVAMVGIAIGIGVLSSVIPVLPVARRSVAQAFQRTA